MSSIRQLVEQFKLEGIIEDALVWIDDFFYEPHEADELGARIVNIAFHEQCGIKWASIAAEVL